MQILQWLKKSFWYPVTVMFVAVQIVLFLMVKVVPTFRDVFVSFGAKLPASTAFCVLVSDYLQLHLWALLLPLPLFLGLGVLHEKGLIKLGWLKPEMLIIFLGLTIGFIVFAMFIPMFELSDLVK